MAGISVHAPGVLASGGVESSQVVHDEQPVSLSRPMGAVTGRSLVDPRSVEQGAHVPSARAGCPRRVERREAADALIDAVGPEPPERPPPVTPWDPLCTSCQEKGLTVAWPR